jgi:hypothetical protein
LRRGVRLDASGRSTTQGPWSWTDRGPETHPNYEPSDRPVKVTRIRPVVPIARVTGARSRIGTGAVSGKIRANSTRRGVRFSRDRSWRPRMFATRVSLWYLRESPFVVMDELVPAVTGAAVAVRMISPPTSAPTSTELSGVCASRGGTWRPGSIARELASSGDDDSSVDCVDD